MALHPTISKVAKDIMDKYSNEDLKNLLLKMYEFSSHAIEGMDHGDCEYDNVSDLYDPEEIEEQ